MEIPPTRGEFGKKVPDDGAACFQSLRVKGGGAQPLWAGRGESKRGLCRSPGVGNCPAWQRQTPRWQGSLVLRSSFRSSWGSAMVSQCDQETGEGVARAVGMHTLGTYADVRAEILSLKHRGPASSPRNFLLILFPGSSLLVAVHLNWPLLCMVVI